MRRRFSEKVFGQAKDILSPLESFALIVKDTDLLFVVDNARDFPSEITGGEFLAAANTGAVYCNEKTTAVIRIKDNILDIFLPYIFRSLLLFL